MIDLQTSHSEKYKNRLPLGIFNGLPMNFQECKVINMQGYIFTVKQLYTLYESLKSTDEIPEVVRNKISKEWANFCKYSVNLKGSKNQFSCINLILFLVDTLSSFVINKLYNQSSNETCHVDISSFINLVNLVKVDHPIETNQVNENTLNTLTSDSSILNIKDTITISIGTNTMRTNLSINRHEIHRSINIINDKKDEPSNNNLHKESHDNNFLKSLLYYTEYSKSERILLEKAKCNELLHYNSDNTNSIAHEMMQSLEKAINKHSVNQERKNMKKEVERQKYEYEGELWKLAYLHRKSIKLLCNFTLELEKKVQIHINAKETYNLYKQKYEELQFLYRSRIHSFQVKSTQLLNRLKIHPKDTKNIHKLSSMLDKSQISEPKSCVNEYLSKCNVKFLTEKLKSADLDIKHLNHKLFSEIDSSTALRIEVKSLNDRISKLKIENENLFNKRKANEIEIILKDKKIEYLENELTNFKNTIRNKIS